MIRSDLRIAYPQKSKEECFCYGFASQISIASPISPDGRTYARKTLFGGRSIMRQLIAFAKKELKENWRTGKIITLSALTVIFGIMNPLLAKLTPYLVQAMSTTLAESGISVQKIIVDATTSWTQFYKNIPMLLIFFTSFIQRDIDKRIPKRNNHQLADKGMKRWKIFLSKWIMGILFWSVSYWCCYSITLSIHDLLLGLVDYLPSFIYQFYLLFFWLLALFIDFIFIQLFLSSNYAVLLASGERSF